MLSLPLNAATAFGLWLNLERSWARLAYQVLRGTAAAFSDSDPGADLFDAASIQEVQALLRHWEARKVRMFARAQAQIGE